MSTRPTSARCRPMACAGSRRYWSAGAGRRVPRPCSTARHCARCLTRNRSRHWRRAPLRYGRLHALCDQCDKPYHRTCPDFFSRRVDDRAVAKNPTARRTRDYQYRASARVERDSVHLSGSACWRRLLRRRLRAADRALLGRRCIWARAESWLSPSDSSSANSRRPGKLYKPLHYPLVCPGRGARAVQHLSRQPGRRSGALAAAQSRSISFRTKSRNRILKTFMSTRWSGSEPPRFGSTRDSLCRPVADRVRYRLRGLGATEGTGANLLSHCICCSTASSAGSCWRWDIRMHWLAAMKSKRFSAVTAPVICPLSGRSVALTTPALIDRRVRFPRRCAAAATAFF